MINTLIKLLKRYKIGRKSKLRKITIIDALI